MLGSLRCGACATYKMCVDPNTHMRNEDEKKRKTKLEWTKICLVCFYDVYAFLALCDCFSFFCVDLIDLELFEVWANKFLKCIKGVWCALIAENTAKERERERVIEIQQKHAHQLKWKFPRIRSNKWCRPTCQVPNTGRCVYIKNKHSTDSLLHHQRINKLQQSTEKRANV